MISVSAEGEEQQSCTCQNCYRLLGTLERDTWIWGRGHKHHEFNMASGKIKRMHLGQAAGVDNDLVIIAVEQSTGGWIK